MIKTEDNMNGADDIASYVENEIINQYEDVIHFKSLDSVTYEEFHTYSINLLNSLNFLRTNENFDKLKDIKRNFINFLQLFNEDFFEFSNDVKTKSEKFSIEIVLLFWAIYDVTDISYIEDYIINNRMEINYTEARKNVHSDGIVDGILVVNGGNEIFELCNIKNTLIQCIKNVSDKNKENTIKFNTFYFDLVFGDPVYSKFIIKSILEFCIELGNITIEIEDNPDKISIIFITEYPVKYIINKQLDRFIKRSGATVETDGPVVMTYLKQKNLKILEKQDNGNYLLNEKIK